MSPRLHLVLAGLALSSAAAPTAPEAAAPNDNRSAAGRLVNGVLTLRLEAREVRWYPEGPRGAAIPIPAFGEAGKPAMVPGPMIRVPAGTELRVSMHNTLMTPMWLHGLHDRAGATPDSMPLAPGETRIVRFHANAPGNYYYWGRTSPLPALPGPGRFRDALLLGAFIVDSAGTKPAKSERVLVINMWSDTVGALGLRSEEATRLMARELFPRERWIAVTVNGLSWPHTERLSYTEGDTVRWRVINGSQFPHPMHLHGFYFDVRSRGDARRDTVYTALEQRKAVTEWMLAGTTMTMTWTPTRPGNWLFHCHIVQHISDALRLDTVTRAHDRDNDAHEGHAERGMAGLVMGIRVAPRRGTSARLAGDAASRRKVRLFVTERAKFYGDRAAYSFVLQEGATPPARWR